MEPWQYLVLVLTGARLVQELIMMERYRIRCATVRELARWGVVPRSPVGGAGVERFPGTDSGRLRDLDGDRGNDRV